MQQGTSSAGARGVEIRSFSADTAEDARAVINTYLDGWPYTRPIDGELLAYWQTRAEFQSEHVLIAYRDGMPRAFVHGVRQETQHNLALLALCPDALEEAGTLLATVEARARAEGVTRLCGPAWSANLFYGGYVLGCEPYHPHWAVDTTRAYVRAGFRLSHPGVILVRNVAQSVEERTMPAPYVLREADTPDEHGARAFRYVAQLDGQEVATCAARLYPDLRTHGRPLGQIGYVGTDEAHRGQGLAKVLVLACLRRLVDWGAGDVLIATGLDNSPALKAYEAVGFVRQENVNEWSKVL